MSYRVLRAISEAGVNVRGVSAVVMGNRFAAHIGFDTDAFARSAAKALQAMDKPMDKRHRQAKVHP